MVITDKDQEALYRVWLDGKVTAGIAWLLPTVERIIRHHREQAWEEGYATARHEEQQFGTWGCMDNPYREAFDD